MINSKRIVPITKSDLITTIAREMSLAGTSYTKISAAEIGKFNPTSGSGNMLADEPLKSLNFGSSVTSAVVYFIADYDYEGFAVNGTKVATSGATVDPDGVTLYTATLATGAVTIAKVGF